MGYEQWAQSPDGTTYSPVGRTVAEIAPGYYDTVSSQGQIFFCPVRPRNDALLEFPDSASKDVLDSISDFWDREEIFQKYDLPYKRGILLYGPPGSGKTCTLQLISREVVKRGGIVVTFQPASFLDAYRAFRDVQPDTYMVVLMEDLEATLKQYESRILNLLDGVEALDKVVFLATCFTPDVRFLTKDLRWVPCGDLQEGDELWALDDERPSGKTGQRRYRKAVVTHSSRAVKECVRVTFNNGESLVCTTDHPWLASKYGVGKGQAVKWVQAKDLLNHEVVRPLKPWETETSWDAGWLSSASGAMLYSRFTAKAIKIEPVGIQEIQSISTSTGTYIAEGYACHNTNYPEKLESRVINRPSRFDLCVKVGHPDARSRRVYLTSMTRVDDDIDVERYVNDTEGMSLAHVKELFVATVVLGCTYEVTIKRLRAMRDKKTSLDDEITATGGMGMFGQML